MRNTRDKRNILVCKLLLTAVTLLLCITVCGAEGLTQDIMEFSGADRLSDMLPESLSEDGTFSDISPEKNGMEKAFDRIASLLLSSVRSEVGGFLGLCAFAVMCTLIRLCGTAFTESTEVINYVCILCMSGYCYGYVSDTVRLVGRAISELDTFMTALLPITASLYTVSGNAASAVIHNAGIYTAMTIFEKINASLLTPLFNFCFALAIVCRVSSVDLSGIVKFIKSFIVRTCVTLLTLLVSLLFFQNTFASAADSMAMRGVKYAASFIPIVGALVGEATRTVAAGISLIKTTSGVFAAAVVLYTVSIPATVLVAKKILLSLCVVVCRITGSAEAEFIEEINSILSILLSILLSVGIFFILTLTIFIRTAVNI